MIHQLQADGGAHFYKCDFQVHTPRDSMWKGDPAVTPQKRAEYADSLISACRDRGLDAIAITDHHDLTMFPYVRDAALRETGDDGQQLADRYRIHVFPGVELTLGVPCQAILLLDTDFPEERFDQILLALGIEAHDATASKLPNVVRIDSVENFVALRDKLDSHSWLVGRYIVLPNVSDNSDSSLIRRKFAAKYKQMPCVGGYVDGHIDKLGTGNAAITSGADKNWGNKRIAVFQTSDSRQGDHETLGTHPTWVKFATPSAEAIRQACLAQESRISTREPLLPSVAISRLTVTNSKFMGPIDLSFNGQYNALIGGRGTGKSTLLGYLRWALGDQPTIEQADAEIGDPAARLRSLVEATLVPVDATVEVHFEVNQISHVVRRRAADGELSIKIADGGFEPSTEGDVAALLPIHAYSQKQLSSVALRVDELSRFIEAPVQQQLDDIDRRFADTRGHLRENYATLVRHRTLTAAMGRSRLRVRSLEVQAENLRKGLTGLTEDDQKVLASKPAYDKAKAAISRLGRRRVAAADAVAETITALSESLSADAIEGLPADEAGLLGEIQKVLERAVDDLHESLLASLATFTATTGEGSDLEGNLDRLRSQLTGFEEKYEAVKARSSVHEEKLLELAGLEADQSGAQNLLVEQEEELRLLGDPTGQHVSLWTDLSELNASRTGLLADRCSSLKQLSGDLIDAQLQRGAGLSEVQNKFQSLIRGSNVRGARIDQLFEGLKAESEPLATWSMVLNELEMMMQLEPESEVTSEQTPVLSRLGFTPSDQNRIKERMSPDGWLDLALTAIQDVPSFRYRIKEDDYIDFAAASAGQQATALLKVLLAQGGVPLLIDQPEDDLDSEIVLDVAQQLWTAKTRRQLIFASHNANLVVNGDAELVVVCENRTTVDQSGGQIGNTGAIDIPDLRNAITRVMEGGKRAFLLRMEKYGF